MIQSEKHDRSLEQRLLPAWAYLAVPPKGYEESLIALLTHEGSSLPHDQTEDVVNVYLAAQEAMLTLKEYMSSTWVWRARLDSRDWSKEELVTLGTDVIPPLRYWVELSFYRADDLNTLMQTISLSPVEMRLITKLNQDLGRRIGDELDGVQPV